MSGDVAAPSSQELPEDLPAVPPVARSVSPQMPQTFEDHIPLGGDALSWQQNRHLADIRAVAAPMDDEDEELERMAQKEMEEDDNFCFPLPTKPSQAKAGNQFARCEESVCDQADPTAWPPLLPQLPERPSPDTITKQDLRRDALPPRGPGPPVRGPLPKVRRSSKDKSKFQERDAIINCILNDEPPSRSTTPKGSRKNTPRGSSTHRSSLKTPVMAGGRRSQSHDIHFDGAGRRTPPDSLKVLTPRQLKSLDAVGSGKPVPHMLDILNLPGDFAPKSSKPANGQPGSPVRSDSSGSSLPQLSEKRSHVAKSFQPAPSHSAKSARSWRDNVVSFYGS